MVFGFGTQSAYVDWTFDDEQAAKRHMSNILKTWGRDRGRRFSAHRLRDVTKGRRRTGEYSMRRHAMGLAKRRPEGPRR